MAWTEVVLFAPVFALILALHTDYLVRTVYANLLGRPSALGVRLGIVLAAFVVYGALIVTAGLVFYGMVLIFALLEGVLAGCSYRFERLRPSH